jgi:hypothetical protein
VVFGTEDKLPDFLRISQAAELLKTSAEGNYLRRNIFVNGYQQLDIKLFFLCKYCVISGSQAFWHNSF